MSGSLDRRRLVLGLLLLAPAVIALSVSQVWPTVRTVIMSLREVDLAAGDHTPVGLDNYRQILGPRDGLNPGAGEMIAAHGNAFGIWFWPAVVLVVVAPLLAWAAHRAGRWGRLAVRLSFAVPMVCFVPVALAAGWYLDRSDGLPNAGEVTNATSLGLLGVICGLALTAYLSALRDRTGGGLDRATLVTVVGLASVAATAAAWQAFTFPYAMTRGRLRMNRTPMIDVYLDGFLRYQEGALAPIAGQAAARAVLILIPVMVLGVGAAILVIASGLRLELHPPTAAGHRPHRPRALVVTLLGLAAVLAVVSYGLWPWLSRLGGFGAVTGPPPVPAVPLPWLPPLISTVVGVGLAAMAGYAIGALRPLGRRSELLLLPFAPWLFVGIGPAFVARYDPGERTGSLLELVPPVWLVVLALFLFTLLFRGLAQQPDRRAGRMILLALPMAALVGAGTWLVQSQSLLWGVLVTGTDLTGVAFADGDWALRLRETFVLDGASLSLVPPIPVLVGFAIGLAVLQVSYLERIAIRIGQP